MHWERSRWLGSMMLQPYSKKNIQPKDVLRFPWDKQPPRTKEEWIKENIEIYNLCNKLAEA